MESSMEDLASVVELKRSESAVKRDIVFKYLPIASSACLTAFASTMDPSVLKYFGAWSDTVRNSLWMSSCAGVGMWIYDRPHLKQVSDRKRAFFAIGLSSIFVQGSFLICAIAKKLSADKITHTVPQMMLGATLAGGCLHLGKAYMDLVDGDIEYKEDDDEEEEEENL